MFLLLTNYDLIHKFSFLCTICLLDTGIHLFTLTIISMCISPHVIQFGEFIKVIIGCHGDAVTTEIGRTNCRVTTIVFTMILIGNVILWRRRNWWCRTWTYRLEKSWFGWSGW